MSSVLLTLSHLSEVASRCLANNGCDAVNARAIAAVVTAAERDGCSSHGLFRMPGYVASLRNGKVNGRASPRVQRTGPGVLRFDGDGGFAPTLIEFAMGPTIDAMKDRGIVCSVFTRMFHYSALWYELEAIANAGYVVMGFLPSAAAVAPAHASSAFFGTNPMGFGWPREGRKPMVFDQSSATRARGEVMIAAREGASVPLGTGLDSLGNPTTDPNAILHGGVQLPFGGHKGSAIGLMVELLGGGLLGCDFGYEAQRNDNRDGGPTDGGELLIVMNPSYFGDRDEWSRHCEGFFAALLSEPGVRLPGDRRYANRVVSEREGVEVDAALYESILALTERH